jgi:hypothetical protein
MDRTKQPTIVLAALLTAAAVSAGCGSAHQPVSAGAPTHAPTISTSAGQALASQPAAPSRSHGGRGGSGTGGSTAGRLPADWPQDLPVPQGTIIGSTGSAGRWTVLILAAGSAAEVHRSTLALYAAAGFTAVSDSVLNKGKRQITLVVENEDHSAAQTNLVIGVTTS